MYTSNVNLVIAEVIDVVQLQSGEDEQNLYSVKVQIFDTSTTQHDISARPASLSLLNPPVKGEHVLLVSGPNQYSGKSRKELQWYYLCTLPIQSSVYTNMLPGAASTDTPTSAPIPEKIVNPLQPFTGDSILQGRYGNTIRLGSSAIPQDDGKISVATSWEGQTTKEKKQTDPIIVLSNTVEHEQDDEKNPYGRKYTIENLNRDASSLYLTSTQRLPTLRLSGTTDKSGGYNKYNGSQHVAVADRVTLVAKDNSIILDAKKRVNLNAEQVLIGGDDAGNPMVHGTQLVTALLNICSAIRFGQFGSGAVFTQPTVLAKFYLELAEKALSSGKPNSILSDQHYMKNQHDV